MAMEMSAQLFLRYRQHLTAVVTGVAVFSLTIYAAPRLMSILTYFWPLLASTAVFLAAMAAFGGMSELGKDSYGEKAGSGILHNYVASRSSTEYPDNPPTPRLLQDIDY